MVAELDSVRSGAPLAELESRDERLAERNAAANRLAEAKAQYEAETEHGEAQIREAEINITQIDKVQAESIEAQKAQLKVRQTDLQTAKLDLGRTTRLKIRNAVTQEDVDHQVLNESRRKHEVAVEQANLSRLTLDRDISLTLSRARLQTAQATLKRARALIPLRSLEQDLAAAEARLLRTTIRAPIDGQVLKILTWPGEATGGKPILKLADTRLMDVVAEVYETDIGRVRLGQKASVTSPSLPRPLTGVVNRVGALIYKEDVLHVDPTADADARVVEVRIRLDDAAPAAGLTNLQVDVRIGAATEAQ
jgi:HlyD family secretion protein